MDRRTLSEQAFEALRTAILDDQYPPGTELQEVALAASFGISRGPVREALGRLSAEGLVTIRPRRGAIVTALNKKEFLEAYQVREALEVLAIRLAVRNRPDELLAALEKYVEGMDAAAADDDIDAFFELNSAFHNACVEASGNQRLMHVHAQVVGTMRRYRRRSLQLRGDLQPSIAEHRLIVDAVRAGDGDRAALLLAEHIRVPQAKLADIPDDIFEHDFVPAGGAPTTP